MSLWAACCWNCFFNHSDDLSSECGVYSVHINVTIVIAGFLSAILLLLFYLPHTFVFLYFNNFFCVKYFLVYNFDFPVAFIVFTMFLSHFLSGCFKEYNMHLNVLLST